MLKKCLTVFFVAMVPVVELRGAIPLGLGMGVPAAVTIMMAVLGNMVPVPLIYMFARKFLLWGAGNRRIGKVCKFFLEKGEKAGKELTKAAGRKGTLLALMLFVGIPLPGTGAWCGTLAASLLEIGPKTTAVAVSLGCILSTVIMTVISALGLHIFGL